MKESVRKFNTVAGKLDPELCYGSCEGMWVELENASERVVEESRELQDACLNKDPLEILDGLVDVFYTAYHVQLLLEMLGVDVESAKQEVAKNNTLKFYSRFDPKAHLDADYHTVKEGEFVGTVEAEFDTEEYLVNIRDSDGKVMKPVGHPSPQIKQFIPDKVFSFLGGI